MSFKQARTRRLDVIVDKAIPDKTRVAIFKKLAQLALGAPSTPGGLPQTPDVKAAALLLSYVYGKPVEKQEVSGPGGGPIPLALETALSRVYGNPSSDALPSANAPEHLALPAPNSKAEDPIEAEFKSAEPQPGSISANTPNPESLAEYMTRLMGPAQPQAAQAQPSSSTKPSTSTSLQGTTTLKDGFDLLDSLPEEDLEAQALAELEEAENQLRYDSEGNIIDPNLPPPPPLKISKAAAERLMRLNSQQEFEEAGIITPPPPRRGHPSKKWVGLENYPGLPPAPSGRFSPVNKRRIIKARRNLARKMIFGHLVSEINGVPIEDIEAASNEVLRKYGINYQLAGSARSLNSMVDPLNIAPSLEAGIPAGKSISQEIAEVQAAQASLDAQASNTPSPSNRPKLKRIVR